MTYKAKVAVCSEIRTKHSAQSEQHVEFLNVELGGTTYVKKPLGFKTLTTVFNGFKYCSILRVPNRNFRDLSFEVCHPRCVFKLYGKVNSVKNTTMNIWLNDGVY